MTIGEADCVVEQFNATYLECAVAGLVHEFDPLYRVPNATATVEVALGVFGKLRKLTRQL